MASQDRTPPSPLKWFRALSSTPYAFDFFVVLRRVECFFRQLPRAGLAVRPSEEPIRVGQQASLAFAPSALVSFDPPSAGLPGKLVVAFLGLFGPQGPLPLHLTEHARERAFYAGDRTFTMFADLFHHRALLLFYRAWAVCQPTVGQDREESSRFSSYVGSTFGIGSPALSGRDGLPDRARLQYAGWFSAPTRHADGLCGMVAHFTGLCVAIEEFVGHWAVIAPDDRWRLGISTRTGVLGRSAVLGARAYCPDQKFRVALGPLEREDFMGLLPGSVRLARLAALVRLYVGDELAWDVRLIPRPDIGDQLELARGNRLGWNARLGRARGSARTKDVIVDPFSRSTQRTMS